MIPNRLNIGDTIGVCAPSGAIVGESVEELEQAKNIIMAKGFRVKYAKNIFSTTYGYSATPSEKAEDLNSLFADQEVKMIWCAKGGENSNSIFDLIDYDNIKVNPKIFCGFSDITSLSNMITFKTGLVTFSGTNFKTIATDETDFSLNDSLDRFVNASTKLGNPGDYEVIREGQAIGELVGGNLQLTHNMVCGKYSIDFKDKILFLEDLGFESEPDGVDRQIHYMLQNGVFDTIKGLWIGNYTHPSGYTLVDIVINAIKDKNYTFPIVHSENFGHIDKKITIPVGALAKIDSGMDKKVTLVQSAVK